MHMTFSGDGLHETLKTLETLIEAPMLSPAFSAGLRRRSAWTLGDWEEAAVTGPGRRAPAVPLAAWPLGLI